MKKLADFKDENAISVAANVFGVIMEILANKENAKMNGEKNPLKMFSAFMANSPAEMRKLFAILSEKDPEEYHCDGAEALTNVLILANDDLLRLLFTSQSRTGDATSSGSASENTEG